MAGTRTRKARLEVVGLEGRTSLSSFIGDVSVAPLAARDLNRPSAAQFGNPDESYRTAAVQAGTPNAIVGPDDRGSIAVGGVRITTPKAARRCSSSIGEKRARPTDESLLREARDRDQVNIRRAHPGHPVCVGHNRPLSPISCYWH